MSYRAEIDEDACAGHGDCVELAPTAFALDDIARVIGPADDETLMRAAEGCPSTAIRLLDAATGEQMFP